MLLGLIKVRSISLYVRKQMFENILLEWWLSSVVYQQSLPKYSIIP